MKKPSLLNITRRDFISGIAIGLTGCTTLSPQEIFSNSAKISSDGLYYPPVLTGLRGNHAGSFEVAHSVAWQGKVWPDPERLTDDVYDLVVVGGGISGLAAAYFFQQQAGNKARILILDNHDDFGGHAKRNEFSVDGKTLIGYGGSESIDGPASYSKVAKSLLKSLSIDTQSFYGYYQSRFYEQWKLGDALFFDSAYYETDKLVDDPFGEYAEGIDNVENAIIKIKTFPISDQAKTALIALVGNNKDYFTGISDLEKKTKLRSISYTKYLQQYLSVPKEATDILRDRTKDYLAIGFDALSALEAVRLLMPGMQAYENLISSEHEKEPEPYIFHFPDGNAGITRALIRALIPSAMPGSTMEEIVSSKVDYSLLDQDSSAVKMRLNSTAVDVRHTVDHSMVDVSYVRDKRVFKVRGKHVVMACYNNIIPKICPETPKSQREAIAYATKSPLVYTNIALRNWRAFADVGYKQIQIPSADMHHILKLDYPVSMGNYRFAASPDDPIVVHGVYVPTLPDQGLDARAQHKAGRRKLYQLTFDDFEQSIVRQMDSILKKGGFDVERDIAGITVNRWPHGYAYEYNDYSDPADWGPEKGPHIAGRAQIGRISIANSDASAYAYVDGAIDAAYRAVQEQLR